MSNMYTAVKDFVLIRIERKKAEYTTSAGLIIPVTSDPLPEAEVAEVLQVGPDVTTIQPGDFVLIKDGDTRMMPEDDIRVIPEYLVHAVVEKGTDVESADKSFDHAYGMAIK